MSFLDSVFVVLNEVEGSKWFNTLGWSAIFNMVASFFLICALIPGYLDARRYQKTFFLEENFFKFFFFGASLMWLNSLIFFGKDLAGKKFTEPTLYMFLGFLISNSVSMFVNFYSWNMKKRNMAESAKMGISEQQYWETVISPTLKTK